MLGLYDKIAEMKEVRKMTCDNGCLNAGGLYDPANEHDACGVGMIVDINGNKSHDLVDSALKVLENMKHRGAEGADNKTGDGAGIMVQIPHEFILLQGIPVPEKGKYGTGLVFLPKDKARQEAILSIMLEEIEREGLTLMHLRTVPVNSEVLGESARKSKEVLVFDWDGNPVRRYALDADAYSIAVDEASGKLFAAIVKEDTGEWDIVCYPLNEA